MKKIMFMIMALVASVAFAEPTVKMIKDERTGVVGTMTYFSDEEAKDKANVYLIRNHFESEKKIYDNIAKMCGQPKFYDYVEAEFGYHFERIWEIEDLIAYLARRDFNFCIGDAGYLWEYLEESNFEVFELAYYNRDDPNEEPYEFWEVVIINKNYVFFSVKNVRKN